MDEEKRAFTLIGSDQVSCDKVCFLKRLDGGFKNAGNVKAVNRRNNVCLATGTPLIEGRRIDSFNNNFLADFRTCALAENAS